MRSLHARDADLLQNIIFDPSQLASFQVPRAARKVTDGPGAAAHMARAIADAGPYDANTNDAHVRRRFARVEFLCAYPGTSKQVGRDLIRLTRLLRDGYQASDPKDIHVPPFADAFRLDAAIVPESDEFLPYDLGDLRPFQATLQARLNECRARGNSPIVLAAIESHKSITLPAPRYTPLKKLLNGLDTPNQFLSDFADENNELGVLQQLRQPNFAFGWTLWNMALQCYVKTGGVPWIVQQSGPPEQHIDLTVGLRFARLDDDTGFCLGIATVLDRFGRLVGVVPLSDLTCEDVKGPFRGMSLSTEAATRLITGALGGALLDHRTQKNLESRAQVSVVFHKLGPAPFYDYEMDGIRDALRNKLGDKEVLTGFVPVVESSSLEAFGPPAFGRRMHEGNGIRLQEDAALLYTMASETRYSTPIAVRVQNLEETDCPFTSVQDACAHIQTLCGLHWQKVTSGRMRLPADLNCAASIARGIADGVQPPRGARLWETPWFL